MKLLFVLHQLVLRAVQHQDLRNTFQVAYLMFAGVMGIWTRSDKEDPPPSSHRWAMSLG